MNYRKKILIIMSMLVIVLMLTIITAYLGNDIVCNSYSCYDFLFGERYVFFTFVPLFISASFLFQLIFSERVFNVWKKFVFVAIPLMMIGILSVKVDPIACGNLICIDRTFMIFFAGALYLAFSFLVTVITAIYFSYKK